MTQVTVTLQDGLTEGTVKHTECVLREPTAGDLINASEESEKLVGGLFNPQLVTSPTLVGINTLRRQIVSIGKITGPLERDILDKLSAYDLSLIQQKAEALEHAARELSQRGRADGADDGAAQGDS